METEARTTGSTVGVVLGGVAVFTAVLAYWLVVPGLLFGISAIWLGVRDRGRGHAEAGSVAVALGVVAVLLVPSVLWVVSEAEEWARDCALDPSHDPNC